MQRNDTWFVTCRDLALFCLLIFLCGQKLAHAQTQEPSHEPHFIYDSRGKISGLNNMSDRNAVQDCELAKWRGRIVKLGRDNMELRIQGFTFLRDDGQRIHINMDDYLYDESSMTVRDYIPSLIKEGARLNLDIRQCGAAGRVFFLEAASQPYGKSK